jgi:N-acetyl-gamma-glutamyl-phosphate reductase
MKPKVYIDGEVGTTGLRIRSWLAARADLELLHVPEAQRKDAEVRRSRVLESDLTILCLPDQAAREAASWVEGTAVRVIDASTAHRVAEGWVYGLPELCAGQRDRIRRAKLVTNPGCYAAAFILLARPLVEQGLLSADVSPAVHALSGYTGGGRPLIERWQSAELSLASLPYEAPYALTRVHKHIPEMVKYSGLRAEPQFLPAVGPFPCGMRVQVALPATSLPPGSDAGAIWEALRQHYSDEPFVQVMDLAAPEEPDERAFDPRRCNDTNRIELRVFEHPSGHVTLMSILDNLGKGAAGTAIQSLNLMLGLPESAGLPG